MYPQPSRVHRAGFASAIVSPIVNPLKSTKNQIYIYQIYYNRASRQMLDPGYIPLDNTPNQRPDWYEFWVIRNFLNKQQLKEDSWYGFFSPKFQQKTNLSSQQVVSFVDAHAKQCDVMLFSHSWSQIAYFQNQFEQGETWHPGLLDLSQAFFDMAGMHLNLRSLVTDSSTSVFSNYLVAKPDYWKKWLDLANKLFAIVEQNEEENSGELHRLTSYGSTSNLAPMKTFLQERMATALIELHHFRTLAFDQSSDAPINERLFGNDFRTRRILQACDLLKQQYRVSRDNDYLLMYRKLRKLIPFKPFG